MVLLNKHPVGRYLSISVRSQLLVYTHLKQLVTDGVQRTAEQPIQLHQYNYNI
jgi:hypothetical protein